jgi:hypothetical protein
LDDGERELIPHTERGNQRGPREKKYPTITLKSIEESRQIRWFVHGIFSSTLRRKRRWRNYTSSLKTNKKLLDAMRAIQDAMPRRVSELYE